jgi:tRNA pseudouridine32 synthase/23S rRNA pseudouridine746 synthase/23S rRNA pseudouridine1911/1915/1917 synthase
MVLARTAKAARGLSRQFRERSVEKRYLALVEGRLTGLGTCSDFIAKKGRTPRLVPPSDPDGKPAELTWQALAPADAHADAPRSLLLVQLHTGRPHQVRLQLAARGHPVTGDVRYGAAEQPALGGGIALHSHLLRVEHPATARVLTLTAPLPDAWRPLLTEAHRAALDRLEDRG